jgi:hypothetical protein
MGRFVSIRRAGCLVLRWYYKWDVVKRRQASHGLTESRQKGHWKKMLYQGGRDKNTHTLRQVDMSKWQRVMPRHKGSPCYRIAHGWKNEFGSSILKLLRFLMHFREPGCSLYFIFMNSYIFFFSLTYFFLIFLSFLYTHIFSSFSHHFLFAPLKL